MQWQVEQGLKDRGNPNVWKSGTFFTIVICTNTAPQLKHHPKNFGILDFRVERFWNFRGGRIRKRVAFINMKIFMLRTQILRRGYKVYPNVSRNDFMFPKRFRTVWKRCCLVRERFWTFFLQKMLEENVFHVVWPIASAFLIVVEMWRAGGGSGGSLPIFIPCSI